MNRRIATLGGGYSWEPALVAALGSGAGSLTVVRRCADMADLLALAATGQLDGCLVTADARGLGADAVAHLAGYGVRVVILRGGGQSAVNADGVGAAAVFPTDLPVDALIDEVSRVLAAGTPPTVRAGADISDPVLALSPTGSPQPDTPQHGVLAPLLGDGSDDTGVTGASQRHRRRRATGRRGDNRRGTGQRGTGQRGTDRRRTAVPQAGPAPSRRDGTVVAVWGPRGAPGRSTVALGLADAAVVAGRSVLLVDADVYGGVLAMALGILDESAGLAGACRLSVAGTLDADRFATLCWSVGPRLTALTGISRADRWPEVRASSIAPVLAMARAQADLVIVDCAPLLEADEELTFDTMAPRRNGATLAVLDSADCVLAVGAADPPGVERLVRGLAELAEWHGADEGSPAAAPYVVFNRVRSSAASPAELTAALRRFSDRMPSAFLPEDRVACDSAWRQGRLLSDGAPKSALAKSFAGLLDSLRLAAR